MSDLEFEERCRNESAELEVGHVGRTITSGAVFMAIHTVQQLTSVTGFGSWPRLQATLHKDCVNNTNV